MSTHTPTAFANSVLVQMGFKIIGAHFGVYHLQRFEGPDDEMTFDGVGLFVSPHPISAERPILFHEFNGIAFRQDAQAFSGLIRNWGELDARRLEQSGIFGVPIERHEKHFGQVAQDMQALARPSGDRFRMYALMNSGDIVCYN